MMLINSSTTRQKGLQNNSGPKLSKPACVYLFLFAASECTSKVIFSPTATGVSCQQRRTAVKMQRVCAAPDLIGMKYPFKNILMGIKYLEKRPGPSRFGQFFQNLTFICIN